MLLLLLRTCLRFKTELFFPLRGSGSLFLAFLDSSEQILFFKPSFLFWGPFNAMGGFPSSCVQHVQ